MTKKTKKNLCLKLSFKVLSQADIADVSLHAYFIHSN